jgi:hypothetical protein
MRNKSSLRYQFCDDYYVIRSYKGNESELHESYIVYWYRKLGCHATPCSKERSLLRSYRTSGADLSDG